MRRLFSVLTLVLACSLCAVAQTPDKVQALDTLMGKYHEYSLFNGAVLVAEKGEVLYEKGFGMANFEWQAPNTPATKFRLGSITKQFTSMLVMQMVEQGKLKLDARLSDLLPYYRKDTGEKVTLHHLLTHTSGIPSYTGLPGFMTGETRDPYEVEAFVRKFCSGDLEFEPGSQFRYNNSGYFLLGAILERAAGRSYEDLLQERIFGPVGMKDSGYDRHDRITERRAAGYQKDLDRLKNANYLDMSIPYAAGALYSTVRDLLAWDRALYSDKLLSAESKKKMFTPFLQNYAYGWVVTQAPPPGPEPRRTRILHGGGIDGFNTLLVREPESERLVVLLNNTGPTVLGPMSQNIFAVLDGRPVTPPKRSVADALGPVVAASGVEAAVAHYRRLKAERPDDYDFGVQQLWYLGTVLMQKKRARDAIEVFKLNVEMFPQNGGAYGELAEAYLADGQKQLAIETYERLLAVNPQSAGAAAALKKLREPAAAAAPQ